MFGEFGRAEKLPYNGKLSEALEELVDALETVIEMCEGGIEAILPQIETYKRSRGLDGFEGELPRGVCESFELLDKPLEGIINLLPRVRRNGLSSLATKIGNQLNAYTGGEGKVEFGFFMDIFTPPEHGGEFVAKLANGNGPDESDYLKACRQGVAYLREGWELAGEENDLIFRRQSDGYEILPRKSMRINRGFSYLLPNGQGRVDTVLADGATEKLVKAMPPTGDRHGLDYALTVRVTGNDNLATYLVEKLYEKDSCVEDDTYRGGPANYGEVMVPGNLGIGRNKLDVELVAGEPKFEAEEGLEKDTLGLLRELMDPMFISPNAVHPDEFRLKEMYRAEEVQD
jgi:hypothetical protein